MWLTVDEKIFKIHTTRDGKGISKQVQLQEVEERSGYISQNINNDVTTKSLDKHGWP